MAIVVAGMVAGARRPLFADWSIPLTPEDFGGGEGVTLREVIERIVRAEVGAFERRNEARRLDRVLSRGQIERGVAEGKVSPEGRDRGPAPDEEEAVGTALEGFEDGLYLVVVDGRERKDLDEVVYLSTESRVTFVRLVFLSGA